MARFLASATDAAHFPAPSLPEVAFLGRSNVGKSSVINTLIGDKIARTSSTPGRTRSINFFEVRWPGKPRPEVIFADLPGLRLRQALARDFRGVAEVHRALFERPSHAGVVPRAGGCECATAG